MPDSQGLSDKCLNGEEVVTRMYVSRVSILIGWNAVNFKIFQELDNPEILPLCPQAWETSVMPQSYTPNHKDLLNCPG